MAKDEKTAIVSSGGRGTAAETAIDWTQVRRILVVRLRSIGDTVLATPSLFALRRFLPDAQIDILLEDWVAPLLDGFDQIDNVISVKSSDLHDRLRVMYRLATSRYDVAFNLHGGTTATFLTRASRARHRVGYRADQYGFLYNYRASSSADFWRQEQDTIHSAEHQLALLGLAGVPVDDRPKSRLTVTDAARVSINSRLGGDIGEFALLHPAAAFATKQWAAANFARTAEFLADRGLRTIAIAARHETEVLKKIVTDSSVPIITFDDLTLPEITALASQARLFVGNDSGIAHIAAAVGTPSVVVFGSSNRNHWRPWTNAPSEMVFETLPCQPCPGYVCSEFSDPKCIISVTPDSVFAAIGRLL